LRSVRVWSAFPGTRSGDGTGSPSSLGSVVGLRSFTGWACCTVPQNIMRFEDKGFEVMKHLVVILKVSAGT
jgi:hypothetical protein